MTLPVHHNFLAYVRDKTTGEKMAYDPNSVE